MIKGVYIFLYILNDVLLVVHIKIDFLISDVDVSERYRESTEIIIKQNAGQSKGRQQEEATKE